MIIITTGKKKIQLSVWRVRDHYYDRKKRDSRLSVGCAVLAITTGKKNKKKSLSGGQFLDVAGNSSQNENIFLK